MNRATEAQMNQLNAVVRSIRYRAGFETDLDRYEPRFQISLDDAEALCALLDKPADPPADREHVRVQELEKERDALTAQLRAKEILLTKAGEFIISMGGIGELSETSATALLTAFICILMNFDEDLNA